MTDVYFQVNLGNIATAAMEKTEGSSYMVGSSSRMLCELENLILLKHNKRQALNQCWFNVGPAS